MTGAKLAQNGSNNFSVKEFSALRAFEARDSVVDVYRSVYSLPPYNEPESRIQSFSTSWESRTKKSGFVFAGATNAAEKLVGMAYGWRSIPEDSWYKKLSEALGDASSNWLSDNFEFYDLAVAPSAQGLGIGRELTKDLFGNVKAKTAILLTHQTTTLASQMYLRNGWIQLKENLEVSPGQFYRIMGKNLCTSKP